MAGDLSWELNQPNQAIEYWQTYIQLASNKNSGGDDYDDHLCQIYYNMGYYYFTYLKHPNLTLAKLNFQKCINHGLVVVAAVEVIQMNSLSNHILFRTIICQY